MIELHWLSLTNGGNLWAPIAALTAFWRLLRVLFLILIPSGFGAIFALFKLEVNGGLWQSG